MKNSFVLYHEYQEHFELLTNEDLGELMRAIFEYEINGEITSTLNPMQKMAFSFIKKDLDNNREKYNAKMEANKNNGSKGGRPLKDKTEENQSVADENSEESGNPKNPTVISETEGNPNEPKKADNVSVSEYDTVYDSDSEGESESKPPLPPVAGGNTRSKKSDNPPNDDKKGKKPNIRKYGRYDWIRLSDDEYTRLINAFGGDIVTHYIDYVDEYIQKTKNKNGYKDWNLVIRTAIRDKWGEKKGYDTGKPPGTAAKSINPFMDYVNNCENEIEEIIVS